MNRTYTDANGDLCIAWSEVKPGATLRGLAPIGIRWPGRKEKDGTARVAKGCPIGEFSIGEARTLDGWAKIIPDNGPIIKSGHFNAGNNYDALIR